MKNHNSFLKKTINAWIDFFIQTSVNLIHLLYNIKNKNKQRILVYTDSRGFEITKRINRRNPFSSYVKDIIKSYHVTYYICPEAHTTIFDFLNLYQSLKKQGKSFDAIILHAGIVDFARRHRSVVIKLSESKRLNTYFDDRLISENINTETGFYYEGEPTLSLVSKEMALILAEKYLTNLDNLIWIGCNQIVNGWRGTYWKERPKDLPIVYEYSKILENVIPKTISLRHWDESDVKKMTSDNVHPNKKGFEYISKELNKALSLMFTS